MLGIRQLYPSSVVHVAHVLPLDDDLSHETPSVLLAGIGSSVNVYRIEKQPRLSDLTTIAYGEKSSHEVIAFTPTGHSINVGNMVIRIGALRHQIAIFLTRDLELILVRYQANLSWDLNEKNSASCNQCVSHKNHWCIIYRYTTFTTPFGTGTRLTLGEPVADPQLIVGESGKTAQAIIFRNNVHTIHIDHLKCESVMAANSLTFFGLIGRSRSSNFYHYAWPGEMPVPSGEFRFRSHTKSESTYIYGESDDMRSQRLHENWLQGSPSVADEDLMLDHSIKVLSQKKKELEKIPSNPPGRDPRLPVVHISIDFLEATSLAPLPLPGVPTDCFVQLLNNRSSIYVSSLNLDYNSQLTHPVLRTLTCLRVQSGSAGHPCSPYYIITAPPGPRKRLQTRVYAFSSATTGQYIHHWQIDKLKSTDLNVPQKGIRLTTSHERVVAGVFLFIDKLCSLWLLLDDGSLTEIPDQILMTLEHGKAQDQMIGSTSPVDEEGEFNDCLGVPWTRCDFSGLPRGFMPRSMLPFNHCSYANPNPYIALTQRYVLLIDYVCDVFVVDLQTRCVVGGLWGEGAVTSVCRGPAHSMIVSHSKGTLTLLSPAVPATVMTTKVLSTTGKDPSNMEISKNTLFNTVVQGFYPIWWGYANSGIGESLWGVLVSDANNTYLLSCHYRDGTCPFTLTEHRTHYGASYWFNDEPTLYAAPLRGTKGGDLTLVQCTPTRLFVEHQTIDLPGKATHAVGCRVEKSVCGVIHIVIFVAVILKDGFVLFSCSSVCDPGVGPTVVTPVYRQSHPWSCPPASVAIDMINEYEVAMLIGMWDGCIDFLRLKTTDGEVVRAPTLVYHLVSPLYSPSISVFKDCGQSSVPRSIVRVRSKEKERMQWMVLHDDTRLTVIRYGTGNKKKGVSKPEWKSVTSVMPSGAALWGTCLSSVLRDAEDYSGFNIFIIQDKEIVLLVAGAEGGGNGGLNTSVHTVATMESPSLEFLSDGWQRGFAVQTHSSVTGLLQHTLFLTDGHRLVVASLPQLFRRGSCGCSSDTVNLKTVQEQEDGGDKEHLAVVSPITYHLKRRVNIISNPSQRLTKTLYLSYPGLLVNILDCGDAHSSILVVVSKTSFKVCDFLQLLDQVATCAGQVPPSQRRLESFDAISREIVFVGTAALEGSLGGGRVLVLLINPLRILHTVPVGEGAVMDLSVCRQANHCDSDPRNNNNAEYGTEVLVAVCCGPLVCVYRLEGYELYPFMSHRFETDCISISLSQLFVSVGLGSIGNAFLQIVYPKNTFQPPNCSNKAKSGDALLLEDTLSYISSSDDSENEELTSERQSETAETIEGNISNSNDCIATRLNASAIPKLRLIALEPTLGGGVFRQDMYRDRSVRVDDDGGVYISHLSSTDKKNLECCSPWAVAVGDCQVVMTHCWGLPSAASSVKVEELMAVRAVEQRKPSRLHWCERSGVLLPVSNDCVAIFFGCLDGSLFAAVELPYVFAFPLLRMEQIITDYNHNFESVSIRNDAACASYFTASKYQSRSMYLPFLPKHKSMNNHVISGSKAQYVYESIPFAASCALKAGTRVVVKKGAVWLDAVGEYFLLEKIVLGDVLRFENLIPDVVERNRIEHKYHALRNTLINTLHEEYGNELSLVDCEEILNTW
ncbi:unnamed protein product [Phytomonas sp. Hart1]|nr:unnamed protein product [Phytomonas sp. Hart1]|eukprot:CCW66347.1 unnamed protein product [Phytomonas sp. isolate Hart1]